VLRGNKIQNPKMNFSSFSLINCLAEKMESAYKNASTQKEAARASKRLNNLKHFIEGY
jgi:hypothetical protein